VSPTVAIIDADAASRAELQSILEHAGFRTHGFADGTTALRDLHARASALAILDLDLESDDAFAVCEKLSRILPVLTVTAAADEAICVRALRSGADDCVCRQVAARELVARVRGVLRRTAVAHPHEQLQGLSISIPEMRARTGSAVHDLTRGEAEVLALLLEHAPRPLTAIQIAGLLGARRGTVESRIKSLRRKLGANHILTRGRFGYELV
jgi:two-component system OmpR family response regulator